MLKPLNHFCITVGELPSSYMESMTYYEMLNWLCNYIEKTVIPAINTNAEAVKEIQEFLVKYEDQYEEIKQMMENLIIAINQKFEVIEESLDNRFLYLTNQVLDLIESNYNILKAYVDEQDAYLEDKIDHISIDSIELRDPTTGLISNIQVVVNNLFNTFNTDALTCTEFEALDLTCTGFDAYQITAYEFDTQGKTILV